MIILKVLIIAFVCLLMIFVILVLFCSIFKRTPYEWWCPESYGIQYEETITKTELEFLAGVSILLLVPLYNIDVTLLRQRIYYLMRECRKWKILLYGLDSTREKTISQLLEWCSDDPNHVDLIPPMKVKPVLRIQRIGAIRNHMLNYAKQVATDKFEYVMVHDGDLSGPMSKCGMIDAIVQLEKNKSIFAVSATGAKRILPGIDIIYDSFAYQTNEFFQELT